MFPSSAIPQMPPPFWTNGPTPGNFYNFGNGQLFGEEALKKYCPEYLAPGNFGTQHSYQPVTVSTSTLGIKFDKGVMIAADNLVSYGSLGRFQNVQRVFEINDHTILGATGDYADFQSLKRSIDQKMIEDKCYEDGLQMRPKALCNWLTRVMYQRRSRMNPLFIEVLVGGLESDGTPFLGTVDLRGRAYVEDVVCTGFGKHLAVPLVRERLQEGRKKPLTQAEASDLLRKCMEVLYYRDCRTIPKYSVAVCTADTCVVQGPFNVNETWSLAELVKGYN